MAKRYRLTFFFDEPKQGWSESWYLERPNSPIVDVRDEFLQLATLRAKMLGAGAVLSHWRVSQVLDIDTGTPTARVSLGKDAELTSDTSRKLCAPHDSLLATCATADGVFSKPVYLGGVWISIFDNLRHYKSVDAFQTAFDAWAAEIKNRGLGWLHQVKQDDLIVTGYTTDALTGKTTLELDGPVTFGPKQLKRRVSVDFPGGHESLDGVYLVSPVTGQPNHVITTKPRPSKAFDTVKGSLKTYTYVFVPLGPNTGQGPPATITAQRMARRNRGKASYAEAGRRPGVVRF